MKESEIIVFASFDATLVSVLLLSLMVTRETLGSYVEERPKWKANLVVTQKSFEPFPFRQLQRERK